MSRRRLFWVLVIFVVAGSAWFFVFSKKILRAEKQYAIPTQLSDIPSVFKGWPIEKENLLSNFYVYLPSPVKKQYTLVYQTSKSMDEALDVYKNFLKNKGINFTEESNITAKTLQISLPNKSDQLMLILRKDQSDRVLVALIYTAYEKRFKDWFNW